MQLVNEYEMQSRETWSFTTSTNPMITHTLWLNRRGRWTWTLRQLDAERYRGYPFRLRSDPVVAMTPNCPYGPILLQRASVVHYHPCIAPKVLNFAFCVCFSYKQKFTCMPSPLSPPPVPFAETRNVTSDMVRCLWMWVVPGVCLGRQSRCAHQKGRIDSAITSICS